MSLATQTTTRGSWKQDFRVNFIEAEKSQKFTCEVILEFNILFENVDVDLSL